MPGHTPGSPLAALPDTHFCLPCQSVLRGHVGAEWWATCRAPVDGDRILKAEMGARQTQEVQALNCSILDIGVLDILIYLF